MRERLCVCDCFCACVRAFVCVCVGMRVCGCRDVFVYVRALVCSCFCACVWPCTHIWVSCLCASICVHTCIYIRIAQEYFTRTYINARIHTHIHLCALKPKYPLTHTGISAICINTQIVKHTHTKNRHTRTKKITSAGNCKGACDYVRKQNAYSLNVQRAHSALPKVGLMAKKNTRLNTKRIQST